MDNVLATIVLDDKLDRLVNVTFQIENLKFRCKRCAALCCKLGGPLLGPRDIKRIEKVNGEAIERFHSSLPDRFMTKTMRNVRGVIKKKEDGTCFFLEFNEEEGVYECSIYDSRPAVCRLYPFDFEMIGQNVLLLGFIPCCRGLNAPDGELVNEEFVKKHILHAITELLKRCNQ